jgi:hypothetical protein
VHYDLHEQKKKERTQQLIDHGLLCDVLASTGQDRYDGRDLID